jgi:hypothetical protein
MTVAIAARGFLARNINPVPVLWWEGRDLQEFVGDDGCQCAFFEFDAGDSMAKGKAPDAQRARQPTGPS